MRKGCGIFVGLFLCGFGWLIQPAGATSDELEKYFGEYTYQAGPDCGGKLTLSRVDRGNYLVAVDNACGNENMLATCGEDFVASIVSREPNNAFLLKELEYGISFLVNAKSKNPTSAPSSALSSTRHSSHFTPPTTKNTTEDDNA